MSRKSVLAVALTVVMLLAMLVPAYAAPDWVHGVTITDPTTADPVKVKYSADTDFDIDFDIPVVGDQVQDVWALALLSNQYGIQAWDTQYYDVPEVGAGMTLDFDLPGGLADGWYNLQVCLSDVMPLLPPGDPGPEVVCSEIQTMAVMLDSTAPVIAWVKPVVAAINVTDQYELIAWAWDNLELDKVEFWMRYDGNNDFVLIGEGAPNGVADHYAITWDSTRVPDGWYTLRACATDAVGHVTCADVLVWVENGYSIPLAAGWNLISSPLMLYDEDVAAVLGHLKGMVGEPTWAAIYTMHNDGTNYHWSWYNSAGAGDLDEVEHGKGYWIYMKTMDTLWLRGTWIADGNNTPPEYDVERGWNLIGYTNFGLPPSLAPVKTRSAYLGPEVEGVFQLMYQYIPQVGYVKVAPGTAMMNGAGYWLATSGAGTIQP